MQVKLQGFCQESFYRGRAQAQFPSFCRHCRNVLLFEVPWVGGAFGLIAILSRRHGGCNTRGLEWIPAFQEERRERFSSSPVKPVKYEGIFQRVGYLLGRGGSMGVLLLWGGLGRVLYVGNDMVGSIDGPNRRIS